MKKIILVMSVFCSLLSTTFAVNKDGISTPVHRKCITKAPSIEDEMRFQQQIQQFLSNQNNAQARINASYTLPVIVHIIYWDSVQNISQAQVYSQFDVLNADYAGTGFNVGNCPAAFQSLIANTNISFCKAAKNPNGITLAEAGIERINARNIGLANPATTNWDETYIDNNIKHATTWDASKYLNIWVVPCIYDAATASCGILGYATFPGGATNEDGVVIGYDYFGTLGTVSSPYNKGRTTTHEIGHWLNLRHISGDSECGNDFCADTPPQKGNANDGSGLNYGCPTYPFQVNGCGAGTSPNGELFMDFMDYTDDACMYMFTNDQKTRMQAAMTSFTLRSSLATSTVCNVTPQKPIANFSSDRTSVCPGGQVKFTDLSLNAPTSWSWTFAGGTPSTSTAQNPTVTYNTAGTYAVTLRATNSLGFDDTVRTAYITVATPSGAALPFSEGFQGTSFPPTGWTLVSVSGNNWEQSTSAGGFGTSTKSAYFNNYDINASNNKDDIVTPVINLNGASNPRLKFDVAYARYSNNSKDTLEVLIADACSDTYTSIYKKGGANLSTASNIAADFIPTAGQWRKDSVFIPGAYLNKNVKIVFRNYGAYGNNIYVDNINIYGITSTSTATASFTASDTTVCVGASLTFTNTSTATSGSPDSVRWTIPGGTPATSNSTTTVSPVFNTAGTYTISLVAYKSGVASTAFTKSIRVKAKPTVTVTSPTICAGQTAQPVASGATTYTWTGGLSAASNPITPVLTTTTTYMVTGTTSGCTNTAVSTVTVNALPSVTVTSPTICAGQTAQPVASGASSYTWTGGLAAVSNPTTPVLTTTATYTVTGTTGSCSKTAVATVTVTAAPNVSVTSPTICAGQTAQPIASGASSYTWTGGLTAVSNPTTPALTTTTTYTVTGTTGSCSKTAVATVTVNPLPGVTVTSPAVCAGQTAQPVASGATSYTWTGGLAAVANPTTPALTTTTTYTVTGTTGSCSKTAVATVTVNATAPTVTITPNPASVCTGSPITLTGNGANNYTWTSSQTGTTTGGTLTFTPTGNITVNISGTLTGCSTAGTNAVNVTIKPKPSVAVTSPAICAGQTAQPVASGAVTYTWTGGLSAVANPTTPALTATTSYTVTGTDASSCSATAVSTVTVNITPGTPTITQSHDTLYSSVIFAGASYQWFRGGVLLTSTSTPYLKITSAGTYTVKVINVTCPSTISANFNAVLTGIKNNRLDVELSIIPNPNNGSFEINITSPSNKNYQLRLYNLSGQVLLEEDMMIRTGRNSKLVNLSGIEKGVYFLSITGEDGITTQNIIVQ